MKDVLGVFSFEHGPWPLMLGLVPALVNIFIFIYVLTCVRKSPLSTSFLIFLTALILWRLQEVALHLSPTREAARTWYHFFSVSTNFIGATGLHFVLELVHKEKWRSRNMHLLVLYLPTLLFSMFFASGIEYMRFEHTPRWGWVCTPSHPMSIAAYILIGLHAMGMMILLSIHTWKLRKTGSIRFKRARIVLIGSGAPILAGCTYQILLPIFFHYTPVPLASSVTILFSLAILFAITKYNLLEYSPVHQWDDIVENMNEGILITDNNDTIQYVNSKFCEMLGYSSAELPGTSVHQLVAAGGEDKMHTSRMDQRLKKLFLDKYEVVMKKKDGTRIVFEVNTQPYLDQTKKVIGSVSIHADVTEQRKAAKKIKESESRYRSFIEQASDAIFISEQDGTLSEVNTRACQMLGYSRQQLLSLSMKQLLVEEEEKESEDKPEGKLEKEEETKDKLQNSNPKSQTPNPKTQITKDKLQTKEKEEEDKKKEEKEEAAEKEEQSTKDTKETKERSSLVVRSLRRSDGSLLAVEISSRLMLGGKTLDIVRDITERKKAEKELWEKIQEMDSFIHRTSHDLRGPLASIAGLTELGKQQAGSSEADIYFDKIQYSALRLDGILRQLSKFARVSEVRIEPARIDLVREVDDIVESLSHLKGPLGRIEIRRELQLRYLSCDKTLLITILQNLITNAIRYHDKGRDKPWICISSRELPTAAAVELSVSDNGTGIPIEIQDKVFDMFYQGSTISEGSGLGLYIVKNAIRKLGGSIQLSSSQGQGASFTITLPHIEAGKER